MSQSYRLWKPWKNGVKGNRVESPTHHIRFKDHLGRWQNLAGDTRERETIALAENLMKLVALRHEGAAIDSRTQKWIDTLSAASRKRLEAMELIDARMIASERPLKDHLVGKVDDTAKIIAPGYKQELESRGNSVKHIAVTTRRVQQILAGCGFVFWKDLTQAGAASFVQMHLAKRRVAGEISGKSYNYFVRDFKSFCRWLHDDDRAPIVAMTKLKGVKNAEMDTNKRRALTSEEMKVLLPHVAQSGDRRGMSGPDRALLYRFAFETGMRPSQIGHLTVADFNLSGERGTVTSAAKYVKRRRQHTQMLTAAMTDELKHRFNAKLPGASAFNFPRRFRPAEMLREDLASARTAWIDTKGIGVQDQIERGKSDFLAAKNHEKELAVFYSLRHGHGTALADAGVPEKDIAASMHHSSRKVTERYIHSSRKSLSTAIDTLPDLSYPHRQVLTGTDDQPLLKSTAETGLLTSCLQIGCIPTHSSAVARATGNGSEDTVGSRDSSISLRNQQNGLLAELADAVDSKSTARKGVSVRLR